jgi:AAA family ATP:ADP antiporter
MSTPLIASEAPRRLCGSAYLESCFPAKERKKMIPLACMFFCILFNYTILRNTKDVLIVTAEGSGAETIPFLKTYVLLPGTMLFFALYTKMCSNYEQGAIIYSITTAFLAFFALFAYVMYPMKESLHPNETCDWLLTFLPDSCSGPVAMFRVWTFSLFYLMAELWGSVVLSLFFWGFANQVTSVPEAKKYYPLFGMFANVALVLSGWFVTYVSNMREGLAEGVDAWGVSIKILTAGCLVSGVGLLLAFGYLQNYVVNDPTLVDQTQTKKAAKKSKMGVMDSIRYLMASPYILNLGVLVIGYGMAINLIEVTWKSRLKMAYPDANAYSAFMGMYSSMTGVATIFSMMIGQRFLALIGWRFTALATPVVCLTTGFCFFTLIIMPDMWAPVAVMLDISPLLLSVYLGTAQNVGTKSVKYGMFDPTKEMAYIPLDSEQKTKGKAAIDVIASRAGKSGGSFIQQIFIIVLGSLSASAPLIGICLFLITVQWIRSVNSLAIEFAAKQQQEADKEKGGIELRA